MTTKALTADDNMQVSTPLHMAAAKGHLSIVDTLLAHEADTTAEDFGVGTDAAFCSCLYHIQFKTKMKVLLVWFFLNYALHVTAMAGHACAAKQFSMESMYAM